MKHVIFIAHFPANQRQSVRALKQLAVASPESLTLQSIMLIQKQRLFGRF